ncbi:unnamed protein product [Orchesella dallaii]|uniref:C2H2-type domain-containing protein n=1 Tax=Orchesella dallaii TaxID=48710 RepID=A0ABP1Q0F1_9HEXA
MAHTRFDFQANYSLHDKMKPKSQLKKCTTFSLPQKQLPVCLICLKKVTTLSTYQTEHNQYLNFLSTAKASQNRDHHDNNDLYKLFLYFCKRYLKLKNADSFLEACSKREDGDVSGTESGPHFCETCHHLLGYLLNIYLDLTRLKMQLLSKVKELGEVITESKNAGSKKLATGLLRKLCAQLNVSNHLLVIQLRRKLVEKCSTKAQKMLPTIVLKRHVPDKTKEVALVSLIVLFSLIYGWDLSKVQIPTSQLEKSTNDESDLGTENDIPNSNNNDFDALCIPDSIPLKRTRRRTKRKTNTFSSSSTSFENFLKIEHTSTTTVNILNNELLVKEEETFDHLNEDNDEDDNHFGDDPEWVPSGFDGVEPEDNDHDDNKYPPEKIYKPDGDVKAERKKRKPKSSSSATKRVTKKRRRIRSPSPSGLPRTRGRPPRELPPDHIYDPSLKCKQCNKYFKTRYLLFDHIAKIHEACEKPFQCQTCHSCHSGIRPLRKHLKEHHELPDDKPFGCWFCDKSYSTQQLCDIHRKIFHFTLHQKLFCDDDECQEQFDSTKDQNAHLQTHLSPEQTPEENLFICRICSRGFLNRYRLQLHEFTHKSKDYDGYFKCDQCYAYYRNFSVLMSHYNRYHMEENKQIIHRCQSHLCNLYEVTKKELDTHAGRHKLTKEICIARQNLPPRPPRGGYKKKTAVESNVDNNTNSNTPKNGDDEGNDDKTHPVPNARPRKRKNFPVICEECGLECISRSRLKRHKFVHGEPQFTCRHCQKKFRRRDHLDIHVLRIHSESKLFICEVCGRSCPTKPELKYHVAEHEKRYHCTFCPMRFARRTILTGHERTHTGEKLQCEWCPVSKACLFNIKKHVKKCHPEEYKMHYADGSRTQYRYKIIKDSTAAALRDNQGMNNTENKNSEMMETTQSAESQMLTTSDGNNFNSGIVGSPNVDDILNLVSAPKPENVSMNNCEDSKSNELLQI